MTDIPSLSLLANTWVLRLYAGTRERYGGKEHGVENLVAKTKLEVVCFRCLMAPASTAIWSTNAPVSDI